MTAGRSGEELAATRARLDARLPPGLFALGAWSSLSAAGAVGAGAAALLRRSTPNSAPSAL